VLWIISTTCIIMIFVFINMWIICDDRRDRKNLTFWISNGLKSKFFVIHSGATSVSWESSWSIKNWGYCAVCCLFLCIQYTYLNYISIMNRFGNIHSANSFLKLKIHSPWKFRTRSTFKMPQNLHVITA
jgi:hypothetical protein